MKKYKRHTPLAVYWLDTVEDSSWHSQEEIEKPFAAVPCTIGFYCGHDKNLLYLTNTMLIDGEGTKSEIPIGMIQCVVELAFIMKHEKLHQQLVDDIKQTLKE